MSPMFPSLQIDTSGNLAGYSIPAAVREAERMIPASDDARQKMRHDIGEWVVDHPFTFAGIYNLHNKTYRSYFDEALRANFQDALALRRDPMVSGYLQNRQLPVVEIEYRIVPDNPDDPEQAKVARRAQRIYDSIPRMSDFRSWLLEATFFGKSAVQSIFGEKYIDGEKVRTIVDHVPVNGDKIIWKWGARVPAILVNPTYVPGSGAKLSLDYGDRGPALVLDHPIDRMQFAVHKFRPADADYMFEGDLAGQVGGLGLRGRIYHAWWLRTEVLSWFLDGLQRIGSNGQRYAFYDEGNKDDKEAVLQGLRELNRSNIAAFPKRKGDVNTTIEHISPEDVAYNVMLEIIKYFDEIICRLILGQDLSSQSAPTGMGTGVADLHRDVLGTIVRTDAKSLAETETNEVLGPIMAFNTWHYKGKKTRHLPFDLKVKAEVDGDDAMATLQKAQIFMGLGGQIDLEDIREKIGLKPPKNPQAQAPMGGMPPGAPGMPPEGPPPEGGPEGQPAEGMPPGASGGPPVEGQPMEGQPAPEGPPQQYQSDAHRIRYGDPAGDEWIRQVREDRERQRRGLPGRGMIPGPDYSKPNPVMPPWPPEQAKPPAPGRAPTPAPAPAPTSGRALTPVRPAGPTQPPHLGEYGPIPAGHTRLYRGVANGQLDHDLGKPLSQQESTELNGYANRGAFGGSPLTPQESERMRSLGSRIPGGKLPQSKHYTDQLSHAKQAAGEDGHLLHMDIPNQHLGSFGKPTSLPASGTKPASNFYNVPHPYHAQNSKPFRLTDPPKQKYESDQEIIRYGGDGSGDHKVWICLKVPGHVAGKICVEGGEPASDLHVTLAMLGRRSAIGPDGMKGIRRVLAKVAGECKSISGSLGGKVIFPTCDEESIPVCASVDVPGLTELRHRILDGLEMVGVEAKHDHGYTPHVTLKYEDRYDNNFSYEADKPEDVTFNEICLVVGGNWERFRFNGNRTLRYAGPRPVQGQGESDEESHITPTEIVHPALASLREHLGHPEMSHEDMANMVGASTKTHRVLFDPAYHDGSLRAKIKSNDGSHEMHRSIYLDPDNGNHYISNDHFSVEPEHQRKGIGLDNLSRQVATAQKYGIKSLQTLASRGDDSQNNGYYTWPRLGYDTDLRRVHREKLPPNLAGSTQVSHLMKTPEGRAWWKEHGHGMDMEFDLTPGSHSMKILNAYRQEKGLPPIGTEKIDYAEDRLHHEHAPHNESVDGKEYKGGEFVPKNGSATGSPESPLAGTKVADKHGEPLTVYHGTEKEFDTFKPGSFFTESPNEAKAYAHLTDTEGRTTRRYKPAEEFKGKIPSQFNVHDTYGSYNDANADPDKEPAGTILANGNTDRLFVWDGTVGAYGDPNVTILSGVKLGEARPKNPDDPRPPHQQPWICPVEYGETEDDEGREIPVIPRAVHAVKLDIKNPKVLPWNQANIWGERLGADPVWIKEKIKKLQAEGYDGIETVSDDALVYNGRDVRQWIIFDPKQVHTVEKKRYAEDDPSNPLNDPNHHIHSEPFKQWFGDWKSDPGNASKVVHPQGHPRENYETPSPKPVYHGTTFGGFNRFDPAKVGHENLVGPGFYFTENKDIADSYHRKPANHGGGMPAGANPETKEVYLNIRNPLDLSRNYSHDESHAMLSRIDPRWADDYKEHIPAEIPGEKLYHHMANLAAGGEPFGPNAHQVDAHDEERFKHGLNRRIQNWGYDGITHMGGVGARAAGRSDQNHRVWVAFHPHQIKSTANQGTFDPNDERIHYDEDTGSATGVSPAPPVRRLVVPGKVYDNRSGKTIDAALGHLRSATNNPKFDKKDIASLVGASPDHRTEVQWVGPGKNADDGSRHILVKAKHPDGSHEMTRTISLDPYGNHSVNNSNFMVKPGHQGKGIGIQNFSRQVEAAQRHGFSHISTDAIRADDPNVPENNANGYYTWPRFGYDADIPGKVRSRLPQDWQHHKRISDLMKTPEGRAFWKEHGDSFSGEFDLRHGSHSMNILNAYRQEKGLPPIGPGGGEKVNYERSRSPVPDPAGDCQSPGPGLSGPDRLGSGSSEAHPGLDVPASDHVGEQSQQRGPSSPSADDDGGRVVRYAEDDQHHEHAPHTETIDGKEYRGGEFTPKDKAASSYLFDLHGGDHVTFALDAIRKATGKSDLTDDDIIELTGLDPKDEYNVELSMNRGQGVEIKLKGVKGDMGPLEELDREIHIYANHREIINKEIKINKKHQGSGIGLEIFSREVAQAARLGFDRIRCNAARGRGGYFGYVVWPKMGYDTDLGPAIERSLPPSLQGAKRISDLYKTQEGREWWQSNGETMDMEFDLTEGSLSRRILDEYRQQKGLPTISTSNTGSSTRNPTSKTGTTTSSTGSGTDSEPKAKTKYEEKNGSFTRNGKTVKTIPGLGEGGAAFVQTQSKQVHYDEVDPGQKAGALPRAQKAARSVLSPSHPTDIPTPLPRVAKPMKTFTVRMSEDGPKLAINRRIRYEVRHAPKGGIVVNGVIYEGPDHEEHRGPKRYPGGQYLPAEALAQMTPGQLRLVGMTPEMARQAVLDEGHQMHPHIEGPANGIVPGRVNPASIDPKTGKGSEFHANLGMLDPRARNHVTIEDLAQFGSMKHVEEFNQLFSEACEGKGDLPSQAKLEAMAIAGESVKGHYQEFQHRILKVFGFRGAKAFALVNAVLSANTGWEEHTVGAFRLVGEWMSRGEPKGEELQKLFDDWYSLRRAKKGSHAYAQFFREKREKVTKILEDIDSATLHDVAKGGRGKTPEFGRAFFDASGVPMDTHMQKFVGLDKPYEDAKVIAKNINATPHKYAAFKALVGHTAENMPDGPWKPSEVQEAAWTSLIGIMLMKNQGFKSKDVPEFLTHGTIAQNWDMDHVFRIPEVRNVLEKLGVPKSAYEGFDRPSPAEGGFAGSPSFGAGQRVRTPNPEALRSVAEGIPDKNVGVAEGVKLIMPDGSKLPEGARHLTEEELQKGRESSGVGDTRAEVEEDRLRDRMNFSKSDIDYKKKDINELKSNSDKLKSDAAKLHAAGKESKALDLIKKSEEMDAKKAELESHLPEMIEAAKRAKEAHDNYVSEHGSIAGARDWKALNEAKKIKAERKAEVQKAKEDALKARLEVKRQKEEAKVAAAKARLKAAKAKAKAKGQVKEKAAIAKSKPKTNKVVASRGGDIGVLLRRYIAQVRMNRGV